MDTNRPAETIQRVGEPTSTPLKAAGMFRYVIRLNAAPSKRWRRAFAEIPDSLRSAIIDPGRTTLRGATLSFDTSARFQKAWLGRLDKWFDWVNKPSAVAPPE